MPLKFSTVCNLLQDLEKVEKREPPRLRDDHKRAIRDVIEKWFKTHRLAIDAPSANGVALLSTLFPERRTDRVYGLKDVRLPLVIARCLYLTAERAQQLQLFRTPGHGDLADCAVRVLQVYDADVPLKDTVSVDEVDTVLARLASRCKFSSPAVRSTFAPSSSPDPTVEILRPVVSRLRSFEAKWFIRLILKDFSPVTLDFNHVMASYHFLLPGLLRFQDSFEAAVALLKEPLKLYHANPDPKSQHLLREQASAVIRPRIGVQVGRPQFHKARSMIHCLKLTDKKRWGIERKYDGEFCEIHINLRDPRSRIQIFSKSGKDSTEDKSALQPAINECLRLDDPDCHFKQRCILVGELVVFSDQQQDILPFHKIRKHVSRSGSFLGTDHDSQAHEHEHLMIIFFDVLMIDDEVTLTIPYEKRRERLRQIITKIPGRAMTSEWRILDFSEKEAERSLIHHFSASIAARQEGLILKPADAPYFSLLDDRPGQWHSGFIKLKKDYMSAFGEDRDVADLVVVGASYTAKQAQKLKVSGLSWTNFHLGCLANPEEVRFGRMPVFKVIGMIEQEHCIQAAELLLLNNAAKFYSRPFVRNQSRLQNPEEVDLILDTTLDSRMDVVFTKLVVVEVLGSGFEKPANKDFFMLRHPRILKVHSDRGWKDAVNAEQLAAMAQKARDPAEEGESQEMTRLINILTQKATRKAEQGELRSSLTPRTSTTCRSSISPRSPLALRSANVVTMPTSVSPPGRRTR